MLFPLCRDFIYAKRQGLKFQKEVPIQIQNNILIDQNGHQYQIQTQQQKDNESTTIYQGFASHFETQLNDKDDIIFYIKELKCNGQNIKTNIAINMKQQIQKSTESTILYKQIIKKDQKIQLSFSKILLEVVIKQIDYQIINTKKI
ncbi:unnamed protein product [Paramecium pentaurelia]|uniref:Uncharacterized protein n=1 Tax=Paramecium pentaurelia TaxID=43138 RepID=A0A8S1RYI3_9CILI|nr:unnamed protein product [Paramecium pentaurelia]